MAIVTGGGIPVSVTVASASPHETKLVEKTLDASFSSAMPKTLIGDKAYDSDPLDQKLMRERGVRLISPHKRNRTRSKTQNTKRLKKNYSKRWVVERFFAWLHNFRRVVIRYETKAKNFLGFLQLGTLIIMLRRVKNRKLKINV